jgi:hypothetical protein
MQVEFEWLENSDRKFENTSITLKKLFVTFLRGNGVIINRRLFGESTYNKKNFRVELAKFLKNYKSTQVIWGSNVFFLTDIWSTGPYHFYVDVLSKIVELIENKKFDILNSKIVLFDDNFSRTVVKPLLIDLGLGRVNCLWINKQSEYIFIGKNFFVTKPHIIGSNNSVVINRVYSLIREKLNNTEDIPIKDVKRIVYYYRENRIRKVVNDNEILPLLRQKGVYCTTFDDLSYMDAFKVMSSARLFIGIHGGGLTNMLFMSPGSGVIEIKTNNPNPQNHCYWHLARSLNFDYTMFVAETRGVSNVIEGRGCDVFVDSSQLIELIDNYGF